MHQDEADVEDEQAQGGPNPPPEEAPENILPSPPSPPPQGSNIQRLSASSPGCEASASATPLSGPPSPPETLSATSHPDCQDPLPLEFLQHPQNHQPSPNSATHHPPHSHHPALQLCGGCGGSLPKQLLPRGGTLYSHRADKLLLFPQQCHPQPP